MYESPEDGINAAKTGSHCYTTNTGDSLEGGTKSITINHTIIYQ
jgi:hypothetical protein